jgi:hypothetical protein
LGVGEAGLTLCSAGLGSLSWSTGVSGIAAPSMASPREPTEHGGNASWIGMSKGIVKQTRRYCA